MDSKDEALYILNRAGLLKGDAAQANRNAVARHQNPRAAATALSVLYSAGLLTGDAAQANFNAVVITYSTILLAVDSNARTPIWTIIPPGWLTAERFRVIINLASKYSNHSKCTSKYLAWVNTPDEGREAINTYIRTNILKIERPASISSIGMFSVGSAVLNGVLGKAALSLVGLEAASSTAGGYGTVAAVSAIGAALLSMPFYYSYGVLQRQYPLSREICFGLDIGAAFCVGTLGATILKVDATPIGLCMIAGAFLRPLAELTAEITAEIARMAVGLLALLFVIGCGVQSYADNHSRAYR